MSDGSRPRILAVLSADFGELANALYLLDGTAASAHLIIPLRLYEQNRALAPHTVSSYQDAAELLQALRQEHPQLLLLMSGYLFGVNGLLNVNDLAEVLSEARTMRISIATTDPFLGMLSHLSEETFVHRQRQALTRHFGAVERILRDVTHLYLSPMPNRQAATNFYNPRLVLSWEQKASLSGSLQGKPLHLAERYWLFVLSLEDYVSQCSVVGRSEFDEMLLRMMSDAIAANRRPVVLVPRVARESFAARVHESATILDFCDCGTFRALLLTAEYVFYWNIFSNSVLGRVANRGPVFFFDAGHLARSIPSMASVAMQSYYANAALPMLDPAVRLDATALAGHAQTQSATFEPALAAFRSLPSPDEMLASVVGGERR